MDHAVCRCGYRLGGGALGVDDYYDPRLGPFDGCSSTMGCGKYSTYEGYDNNGVLDDEEERYHCPGATPPTTTRMTSTTRNTGTHYCSGV